MASASPLELEAFASAAVRTVLVPVDFSPHARAAARRACELARACDARVRLIHGLDAAGFLSSANASPPGQALRTAEPTRSRELERWCTDFSRGGAAISGVVAREDPVELIARHAQARDVLLVVMGMHGFRGEDRLFLGSVADRTLRAAGVPVMLVRDEQRDVDRRIRRILVATDFSPAAEHALRLAIQWARRLEADVEILHAIGEQDEERRYARPRDSASRSGRQRTNALEALRSILNRTSAAGVRAVADLTYGAPSIEIVKQAARSRADLVIVGRRERMEGQARYGSVTERVLRHVKCAVLVAPELARA